MLLGTVELGHRLQGQVAGAEVGVAVGVLVGSDVFVGTGVAVGVFVGCGVFVGIGVFVGVFVGVGVAWAVPLTSITRFLKLVAQPLLLPRVTVPQLLAKFGSTVVRWPAATVTGVLADPSQLWLIVVLTDPPL
jgi:hypothetical protein